MNTKSVIKEHYEQLYAYEFDNLDEMDQFLKRPNLLKPTQKQTGNLNRPVGIKETEKIIANLPNENAPCPHGLTSEFYQTLRLLLYITK